MKMPVYLFLLIPFLFVLQPFPSNSSAEPNETSEVEQVIQDLFDAMRAGDGESAAALFTENATLHTVIPDGGDAELRETDLGRFTELIGDSEPGELDEQLTSLEVFVDGALATAWMEYRFYAGGEFSHCGVNSMNLMKGEEGWKIFSVVDTRRQDAC